MRLTGLWTSGTPFGQELISGKAINERMICLKKFILTETTRDFLGITLYQIKAVQAFGDIEVDELGGWVEKEENLSQSGNAWVFGNAWVC